MAEDKVPTYQDTKLSLERIKTSWMNNTESQVMDLSDHDDVPDSVSTNAMWKHKLMVHYTSLPFDRDKQQKICIRMELLENCSRIDHPQLCTKSLVAAFRDHLSLLPNKEREKDAVSFMASSVANYIGGCECWYGFIDKKAVGLTVPERVNQVVSHIKSLVSCYGFQISYLCALKKHDKNLLRGILEYGSDWHTDFVHSDNDINPLHDLTFMYDGYDLWKVGEAIYGAPENWPQPVREAFADVGRTVRDIDNDSDDDSDSEF